MHRLAYWPLFVFIISDNGESKDKSDGEDGELSDTGWVNMKHTQFIHTCLVFTVFTD